jgi:hypothetical protein
MNATEVISLIVTILALLAGLEIRVRALVKTYLIELRPNHGSSIKDQISRLEARQAEILDHIKSNKNI